MVGKLARWSLVTLVAVPIAAGTLAACGSGSESGSDQFRERTDSPILDFGEEGSEAALEEGARAVSAFLTARAAADWPEACDRLSRAVLAKIERLAASATELEDKSCASFLSAFTRLSAKERRDSTTVDAGSLRQRGKRAYVIYYDGSEAVYTMPLSREGDVWKVASLAPERLG